jgi:hypothetical protein
MKPYSDKVSIFCYENELKFSYEHLQFQKFFRLASARHIMEDKGGGYGWQGRAGQGGGGKEAGKGRKREGQAS